MSTARDYLATVQQRADGIRYWDDVTGLLPDTKRLVAALTAALDLADGWAKHGNAQQKSQGKRVIAAITDALTPKENDS